MQEEVADLVHSYRNGGLSRRQLATGLSAATVALATPTLLEGSIDPSSRLPTPSISLIPPTTGGGTDDAPAIQGAIDAVAAAGGGQVLILEHLMLGSRLMLRTGVELVGTGRIGSSLTPLSSFPGASLILIEAEAQQVAVRGLSLDTLGRHHGINVLAGCRQVEISGVRFTGWDTGDVGMMAIRLSSPPDPGGSNLPIREVLIDDCDFEDLAIGVKISEGASHVSVLRSTFRGIHRRCIWMIGTDGRSSSHVRIAGNTLLDFPLDPDHSNPIAIGAAGDAPHQYIHVGNNVVIGNGVSFGPMGGTGDQISLHCLERSQVVCNSAIDSGDTGIVVVDSNDVLVLGNFVAGADAAGFTLKADEARCRRIQFISNWAYNNGQNRDGSVLHSWVPCGYLIRDHADGVVDTLFIGNYAWDDQQTKTQSYALSIAEETITSTNLTANVWRASQHKIGTIYNKGLKTEAAVYAAVPKTS